MRSFARNAGRMLAAVLMLLAVGLVFLAVTAAVVAVLSVAHISPKVAAFLGVIAATFATTRLATRVGRRVVRLLRQPARPDAVDVEVPTGEVSEHR